MNKKAIYSILSVIVAMVVLSVSLVFAIGPKVSADSETIGYLDQAEFFEIDETGVLMGLSLEGRDYADQYDKLEVVFPEGMVNTGSWDNHVIRYYGDGPSFYSGIFFAVQYGWKGEWMSHWDIHEKIISITLPSSLTKIGDNAFANLNNLQTVNLGDGLLKIGTDAFRNCEMLDNITLTDTLVSIDNNAFVNTGLNEITIPASVVLVGNEVFSNCPNLTKINCAAAEKPAGWDNSWNVVGYDSVYDEEQDVLMDLAVKIPVTWNCNNDVVTDPTEQTQPGTSAENQSTVANQQKNNSSLIAGVAGASASVMLIVGIVLGIVIGKRRRK